MTESQPDPSDRAEPNQAAEPSQAAEPTQGAAPKPAAAPSQDAALTPAAAHRPAERRGRMEWREAAERKARRVLRFFGEFRLWFFALVVGFGAAVIAVLFVYAIASFNEFFFDGSGSDLATRAALAPAWVLILAPALGGLALGLLYRACNCELKPTSVAEVIAARVLRHGVINPKEGFLSCAGAAISLGFGASAGREGPAVVAGAALSSLFASTLKLSAYEARTLLGCAVAAAVSASFNAPIAGALFALEVVLGHYAIRAFAPITIASVAGALLSRFYLGAEPAFSTPALSFGSPTQFPAFVVLGLVAAAVAVAMMASIFLARDLLDRLRERLGAPVWLQPAIAGLMVGLVAVFFPHVVGVGYETTSRALAGVVDFETAVLFAMVKTVAVAITLGGRFAGGVFSPALMVGALTGAAFGSVAAVFEPDSAADLAFYALAGMGAVAGAVLGAPISTTLIVFELTGDYSAAIAVMISTSVATVAVQQTVERSYFHWALARRGMDLSAGPLDWVMAHRTVGALMTPRGVEDYAISDTAAWSLAQQGVSVTREDTLAKALPMFRDGALPWLPVVDRRTGEGGVTVIGALYYVAALRAYSRALEEIHAEEHS